MTDLSGHHALVTGGGSGVGAAIAAALAEAGATVTICGRREAPLRDITKNNSNIHGITADVTDPSAMQRALDQAGSEHGAPSIVVANAGAAISQSFDRTTSDDFAAMLDLNLGGVFHTWQAGLASMKQAGWGRLIAIASTAGLKGYPYVAGYCAAKHGVIGLTRALSLELAKTGITVNAICPGFTDTPMLESALDKIVEKTGSSHEEAVAALKANNPQRRFIQPAEVANSVLWLCGEECRSVTGQAIAIAGGEV